MYAQGFIFAFFILPSGFRLSNRSLSAIILRFSNKKGEVEFDDFVLCAIRLKTMLGKKSFMTDFRIPLYGKGKTDRPK